MTLLDGPMAQVANQLVGTFGRPASLRRYSSADYYNPETLKVEAAALPTDTPCSVAFVRFEETSLDTTLIQDGDRAAIVPRLSVTTQPVPNSDELVEGGRVGEIVRVGGISSGAQEAAYELHLRGPKQKG
jgi:hypothetical protein